ncbi:Glycosyl transferase protein [Halorhabdus tiamatea SARL4B]|uniref:Glycosyl transferase protein n=1 Tax=Halorhabdus tiamatea SARL4B TaxID=1033806 RepID=U2FAA1_9EURY|nr:glycosyltransferase [Halorhabdus tiamatea]ERJ05399.1 Glycosyl transferase protein [Halorhabdus tiamatea SARL4B]
MSVALGTKVFSRDDDLRNLLKSVEAHPIDRVIVADDGKMTSNKKSIYSSDWSFELTIIDLEFDAGLGKGRNEIVNELKEDYLFIVDTDHVLPPDIMDLIKILRVQEELGGIGGLIFEPDHGRIYDGCRDFDESNGGDILKFITPKKEVEFIHGLSFIPWDFIPNAAVFRREAVMDYSWDEEYVIGWEHADFYIGHWKQTNWEFGICPDVLIRHYPGGDNYYTSNRNSNSKNQDSFEYFLNKWGYTDVNYVNTGWVDTVDNESIKKKIKNRIRNMGF